tara:strand:- start:23 stop:460 length:438 start_codon:yes stop_codon:yes gene_type:complete
MSDLKPKKYFRGLSDKDAEKKKKNIEKSRKQFKEGKKEEAFKTASKRPTTKQSRTSGFTARFKRDFPDVKPLTAEFAKKTGIPLKVQKEVFKKGKGAFATAGSRSSVKSPEQWAYARLYAFYYKSLDGKLDFDKDLAKGIKFKKP